MFYFHISVLRSMTKEKCKTRRVHNCKHSPLNVLCITTTKSFYLTSDISLAPIPHTDQTVTTY